MYHLNKLTDFWTELNENEKEEIPQYMYRKKIQRIKEKETLKWMLICSQFTSLITMSPEGASTTTLGESLLKEARPSLKSTTVFVLCDQGCFENLCS